MLSRALEALKSGDEDEILEIKRGLNLKPYRNIVGDVENGNISRDLFSDVFIPEHLRCRDRGRSSLVALK